MKIGIATELFPPFAIGGAEISAQHLTLGLAELGHEVTVITPNYGGAGEVVNDSGIRIVRFAFPPLKEHRLSRAVVANPFAYWRFGASIRSAVKKYRIEILHAQSVYSFIPVILCGGVPRVATLRDYSSLCSGSACFLGSEFKNCGFFDYLRCRFKNSGLKHFLLFPYDYLDLKSKRWALRRMQGVISVSEAVQKLYEKIGISSTVIYNAAPPQVIEVQKEEAKKKFGLKGNTVTYAGKISLGKGIRSFLQMARKISGATFVIAGDGPLKSEVLKASEQIPNLKYLGHIPYREMPFLYAASDVLCSTSLWPEPLSRTVIEALSYGVPCVATRVGGTPEIVDDGTDGFLVEPDDAATMIEKVKILLSNEDLRRRFAENGRRKAKEKFSLRSVAQKHVAFYEKILEMHA